MVCQYIMLTQLDTLTMLEMGTGVDYGHGRVSGYGAMGNRGYAGYGHLGYANYGHHGYYGKREADSDAKSGLYHCPDPPWAPCTQCICHWTSTQCWGYNRCWLWICWYWTLLWINL